MHSKQPPSRTQSSVSIVLHQLICTLCFRYHILPAGRLLEQELSDHYGLVVFLQHTLDSQLLLLFCFELLILFVQLIAMDSLLDFAILVLQQAFEQVVFGTDRAGEASVEPAGGTSQYNHMDKVIRKALQLQKLGKVQGLTHTTEWTELMKCFPLRFDTNLLLKNFPKCIAVRTVYSENDLRLSLYCLPKGITMPTHDHPSMFVLSYLMMGEMLVNNYTRLGNATYKSETRTVKANEHMVIEGEKNNLHSMTGLEHSLFLDVIFPDYNYTNRLCTHYREKSPPNQANLVQLETVE